MNRPKGYNAVTNDLMLIWEILIDIILIVLEDIWTHLDPMLLELIMQKDSNSKFLNINIILN